MRKTYAKILSLAVILVMAMVCFTGCIRFRTTMSIKNNGTADLALIYADTDKRGNGLCGNHQERIRKFHADLF